MNLSALIKNNIYQNIVTLANDQSGSLPYIRFYAGDIPQTPETAVTTDYIVSIPVELSVQPNGIYISQSFALAEQEGEPTFARLFSASGVSLLDMVIGVDIEIDPVVIYRGGKVYVEGLIKCL